MKPMTVVIGVRSSCEATETKVSRRRWRSPYSVTSRSNSPVMGSAGEASIGKSEILRSWRVGLTTASSSVAYAQSGEPGGDLFT